MDINTAYRGTPHVTAENSADLNRGVVGAESYVLPVGMQFEAELVTNNLIKIRDGCGCMQGRQVSIKKGLSDEITVENGTQGEKRIDIITIRYEKDINTGIERVETILIKGTPSEDEATVPEHIHGDIRAGDTTADWPIYEIKLDGISVVGVRPLFNLLYNAAEIKQEIDSLNSNLSELIIKRSASNKVNVSAGAQSYTYITVSLPAGYSVLSVSAVAAHSTTLCGTASISGDRVYIPYSATTAQAPETFSAEIVLLKTP